MPEQFRVVMASANPDKVKEIAQIMSDFVEIVPRPDSVGEIIEDAETLEGNARLKAVAISEATGLAAMADDTGLEIDHLDGAPGVHTARFAGENATYADNVAKTLNALASVPTAERTARFRTVAMIAFPNGDELVAHGVVEGQIAWQPTGSGGFGYDPIFVPLEGTGQSFAEMAPEAKHAISHRGRAFRTLRELLAERV